MMNIMVNGWIRVALFLSTVILTGVSIVFTVLLWARLPDDFMMQCLTGLAGLALELCKFSLLPLSFLQLQKRQWFSGGVLLALGSALFVVSIGASVSFLETGQQRQEKQSIAWQQRQETIKQLNESIRIGQTSAAVDIESGFRQRGGDTLKAVSEFQQQREQLLKEPVSNDGQVVGLSDRQRLIAWLLLALLIDGCSVAGWSILSGQKEPELKVVTVTGNDFENEQEPVDIDIDQGILERISGGEYGHKISIRGVMEKEQLGYPKVKPVFDELVNQGVIKQASRGYQLINGQNYPLL